MPVDVLPHDLTNDTSHSPILTYASSSFNSTYGPYRALNGDATDSWAGVNSGVDWWAVSLDNVNGVRDVAPHDCTSATSHSPIVLSRSSAFQDNSSFGVFGAFNNAVSSGQWTGQNNGSEWVKIDFGSGVSHIILWYAIGCNEVNRVPKDWTLQGSNDDTNWTTIDTVTNQTGWSNPSIRNFYCDDVSTAYRYFKFVITANVGAGTYTQVEEFYLYAKETGTPTRKTIGSYAISGPNAVDLSRAPKDWKLQGSNDGFNWSDLDTVINQTGWTTYEVRTFNCDVSDTSYQFFRVNITANNTNLYTQINEFYLYEVASAATPVFMHQYRQRRM